METTGEETKTYIQSNLSLRPPDKIADLAENCGHAISVPSICGFKCTGCVLQNATTWEMRIAVTTGRPQVSIQSEKSDHIHQTERKPLFWLSTFFFRMHSERAIIAGASLAVAHVGTGQTAIYIIVDVNSPQGYAHDFILKHFEPNQANETTWERGELIPSVFCGRNYQVRLNL